MKTRYTAKQLSGVTLTISDVSHAGSVGEAIIAACTMSDYLSSGIIGPSFSTSGPGPGWSKQHSASDFAARALAEDAVGYIDAADGRLATLDDDGDVEWSDESVVVLEAPTDAQVDEMPEAARQMAEAIESGHATAKRANDWGDVRGLIAISQDDALEYIGGEIVGAYVLYYDAGVQSWYLGPVESLTTLRKYMGSSDEDVTRDAYSRWCAASGHDGEYETRDDAIESVAK